MLIFSKETISDHGRIKIEKAVTSNPYPIHKHDFIELVYIMGGGGVHTIDGREYPVSHGSLLFIDYGQSHSIKPQRTMTYVNILLEPEFFSRELVNAESIIEIFCYNMFYEFAGKQDNIGQCVLFQKDEVIRVDHLIEMMLQEYEQKSLGYVSVLRTGTQTLFMWLLRKMNEGTGKVILDSVQDVLDYINEHFTEKIELSDIAAKGFYHPDYLSRLLKKYCGKSFTQYIKEKRISRAGRLLETTQLSISEIMQQSGYADSKIFYQHFREIYGMAPGSFRKKG